jgi:heterodisulfide reductase subunit D
LVEMDRNRENSRCCGSGSGVRSAYPDTALLVAQRRIEDAEATEAELIVTTCSFCILNLQNALEHRTDELSDDAVDVNKSSVKRVLDISELILMGLEDEEI